MTVLVTGASRGIGLGLVSAYARAGVPVVGTARGAVPDVAGVTWEHLDLADPAGPRAMAARLGGRAIEVLVCNAGLYAGRGDTLDTGYGAQDWATSFAVNVTGAFLTVQAMLPHLARAARPRIAIIASLMGSQARAPGGAYVYRATKAAAINLGRNLAVDLRGRGIAVGIYHPGWVRTDMGGAGADIDTATSVAGLMARFDALDLADSGCFRNYDGTALAL